VSAEPPIPSNAAGYLTPRRQFWLFIIAVLVLGLGGGGGYYWYTQLRSCTVGLAGTDLQVTAESSGAPAFCQSFLDSSGSAYTIDQPDPTGTLMCRVNISGGPTVTVRDKGALKLYGTAECQQLAQQSGIQSTEQAPLPGS
jgi:hypothetical protein